MNALPTEPAGWSRRRWAWLVTGGVTFHAVLVFWLGERWHPTPPLPLDESALQLATDRASIRALAGASVLSDPTLFALPAYEGFSGAAWLALPSSELPAGAWSEPPRYLLLDTNELGGVFAQFVATNKHNGQIVEDLLQPRGSGADILILDDPVMTQSVVRVEGPLAQCPLLAPLRAPNPPYPDALPDTVVQLKVNAHGLTESAIVLASCGVRGLDNQALTVAQAARFRPLLAEEPSAASAGLTWGRLVFQWFTVPPSPTNAIPLETD